MSYFLFGYIDVERHGKVDQIASEISDLGKHLGLFVIADKEIGQKPIRDMLEIFCDQQATNRINFVIQENEKLDTADSLISPFDAGLDLVDGIPKIEVSINKLDKFQKYVLTAPGVESIHLFLVEGFDNKFEEVKLNTDEFKDKLIHIKSEHLSSWPSLVFKLGKHLDG